tara:strand:+ start:830 stop:1507 length:678 start_codon:yes stop_codon:yes gene_type:complete
VKILDLKFKKKKFWIFDLDNTLYKASSGIFKKIDNRMTKFISYKINVTKNEAFRIQKKLYQKYGTTLFGLMKSHNIDPFEFLEYVHNICLENIKKSEKLKNLIDSLPGNKLIFTNGDEKWARKVICALGIQNSIDEIFDIIKADFVPKPQIKTYKKFLKTFNINPEKSVFFEDTERNLKYANSVGITTVHIDEKLNDKYHKSFVDFRFKCIKTALETIDRNLNNN